MYITYHKSIAPKGDECLIPFDVLDQKVRDFIIDRVGVVETHYKFHDNGLYFFIYLENGDRIDVEL